MSRHTKTRAVVPEKIVDTNVKGRGEKTYTIGKFKGKGGFAYVYEAKSQDSGRVYAAKIISKTSLTKSSARTKLLNEIKIHRSLSHQHVVKFEHFFEDRNNVYILLELCNNQTLMELVKRRKRLTEPEVQCLMYQLLTTCQHLHGKNVIHRDLKLGNLFLKNMSIKVGDFGLATRLDHPEERKRTICGTPNYIAPEILDNRNGHSFEVDTWSIGVILYTLLIGKPPFEDKSVKATYKNITSNIYRFPEGVPISRDAKQLITSILQDRPEKRPSLDSILNHPFFTKYTFPTHLEQSALTTPTPWTPMLRDTVSSLRSSSLTSSRRTPLSERTNSMSSNPTSLLAKTSKMHLRSSGGSLTSRGSSNGKENKGHTGDVLRPATASTRTSLPLAVSKKEKDIKLVPFDNQSVKEGMKHVGHINEEEGRYYEQVHEELAQSFANKKTSANPQTINEREFCDLIASASDTKTPIKSSSNVLHVNKWLDFSKKYGLGYLLSNGNAGVYFNDSSKIVLQSDTNAFEYIERRSSSGRGGQTKRFTLSNYPADLEKKVTLLKHFQSYLKQKADADPSTVFVKSDDPTNSDGDMVYVKKWLRTRHAILFRMSNRTVQVIFFDKTQVVLSSHARSVTYIDKYNIKMVYPLDCIFDVPRPDLSKRMKYIKDVMFYLFSRSKYPGNQAK